MKAINFSNNTIEIHADDSYYRWVDIDINGRLMFEDKAECACRATNMSIGGVTLVAPIQGRLGEKVIAYLEYIGRIEGSIGKCIDGGFVLHIDATPRKKDRLAAQLTWLTNYKDLGMPEDRRNMRYVPQNILTTMKIPNGKTVHCRIIDISLSGAAIGTNETPMIGEEVVVGTVKSKVVRHFEDGIAVEFSVMQTDDNLEYNLGLK